MGLSIAVFMPRLMRSPTDRMSLGDYFIHDWQQKGKESHLKVHAKRHVVSCGCTDIRTHIKGRLLVSTLHINLLGVMHVSLAGSTNDNQLCTRESTAFDETTLLGDLHFKEETVLKNVNFQAVVFLLPKVKF